MHIVSERPDYVPAVRQVILDAFGRPNEADLVDCLRSEGKVVSSLVAVQDEEIVGHILFSPVKLEMPRGELPLVALAPLSVRPDRRREGVGSQLIYYGIQACRKEGYELCVVIGDNVYYPRFGFVPAILAGVECGLPVPLEAFMVMELTPGALSGRSGIVRYPPAFDGV